MALKLARKHKGTTGALTTWEAQPSSRRATFRRRQVRKLQDAVDELQRMFGGPSLRNRR